MYERKKVTEWMDMMMATESLQDKKWSLCDVYIRYGDDDKNLYNIGGK